MRPSPNYFDHLFCVLVARLRLIPRFVAAEECDAIFDELMNSLPWQQETVVSGDETYKQPRLTAWFGELPYSYAGITHPPYTEVCGLHLEEISLRGF